MMAKMAEEKELARLQMSRRSSVCSLRHRAAVPRVEWKAALKATEVEEGSAGRSKRQKRDDVDVAADKVQVCRLISSRSA